MGKNMQNHIIRKWVILGVLLFLAVATILCAIKEDRIETFVNNKFVSHNELDPFNISESDVGKIYDFRLTDSILPVEEKNQYHRYLVTAGNDAIVLVGMDVYGNDRINIKRFIYAADSDDEEDFPFVKVKVVKNNDADNKQYRDTIIEYLKLYFEQGYIDDLDAMINDSIEAISPYHLEVQSEGAAVNYQQILYVAGAILCLASILYFFIGCLGFSWKKVIVITLGIFVLIGILIWVMVGDKLRTYMSVKKLDDGFYRIDNRMDLKTDDLINANISDIDSFVNWVSETHFYGYKVEIDEQNLGCASFSCSTPEGDVLLGRNFDYSETDSIIVFNDYGDGYSYMGIADLTVLGVGDNYSISPDSELGRLYMLAAPYMILDGMNEKGLGMSILELDTEEMHPDTGKPDLLIYTVIGLVLERCADVDEAVAFLDSYDIHTAINVTYHFFLTDRSGRAVVVEWIDGELIVNERNSVTNSIVSPGPYFDIGADWRLPVIEQHLKAGNNVLTEDEASGVLQAASRDNTEWSCVYNLNDFTVTVYNDRVYEHGYTFSGG